MTDQAQPPAFRTRTAATAFAGVFDTNGRCETGVFFAHDGDPATLLPWLKEHVPTRDRLDRLEANWGKVSFLQSDRINPLLVREQSSDERLPFGRLYLPGLARHVDYVYYLGENGWQLGAGDPGREIAVEAEPDRFAWSCRDPGTSKAIGRFAAALLDEAGYSAVGITYDGYGDSGDFEEVTLYKGDGEGRAPVAEFSYRGGDPPADVGCLVDWLADIVEADLEARHPGWEINEGSYGSAMVELGPRLRRSFEHRTRIEEYEEDEFEEEDGDEEAYEGETVETTRLEESLPGEDA
jgi:hypothetical protein